MVALDHLQNSIKSAILVAKPDSDFDRRWHILGLAPALRVATEELNAKLPWINSLVTTLKTTTYTGVFARDKSLIVEMQPVRTHVLSCRTFKPMLLSEFTSLNNAYPMDTIHTFVRAMSEILPPFGPIIDANVNLYPSHSKYGFSPLALFVFRMSIFSSKSDDGELPSKHNPLPVVSLLTSTYPAPEAFSDEYEVEYLLVPAVPCFLELQVLQRYIKPLLLTLRI
ncbi:hypothetical protein R3P38DRAFT_2971389 [Favolaschia claudopus]|uniref:Uncharacterized protein n=1 Tax=Favolaschia claudopus TaxID=2862362 RepID=A0AAW0B5G4_9AGAR